MIGIAIGNYIGNQRVRYWTHRISNLGGAGTITPAELAALTLKNHTKILFNKGETFNDFSLNIAVNDVIVDSYGSGAKPIITSLRSVTGWTDEGGNIWSKHDDNFPSEITSVLINGTAANMARSALKTATGGSNTTLVDSSLSEADTYYDGAEIYINYYTYLFGISRCTTYASKTFTIPAINLKQEGGVTDYFFPVKAGDTYYIQNHRSLLATANQYSYNSATKTLYVYSVAEPANVTISANTNVFYFNGVTKGKVKNLTINYANGAALYAESSSGIEFSGNTINYSGYYGILLDKCSGGIIDSNTLSEQKSFGIVAIGSDNTEITNNTVNKCAYTTGQERYYPYLSEAQGGHGIGVKWSDNLLVQYNEVSNIGNMGICTVSCDFPTIQNNYVHSVSLNKADGGAIYGSYMTNGLIKDNVCTDGNYSVALDNGIYMDIASNGNEIVGNYVTGYNNNIQCDYNHDNYFHDNILHSTNSAANFRLYFLQVADINNRIEDNIFIQEKTDCPAIIVDSNTYAAKFKNNTYYTPFGKGGSLNNNSMFKIGATWKTLAEWKADDSRIDWDRDNETEITPSVFSKSTKLSTNYLYISKNTTKSIATIQSADLPYSDYLDLDGVALTYPYNLNPYEVKVIVRPDEALTAAIFDTFVANDNVLLKNHTPDIGSIYSDSLRIIILSKKLVCSGTSSAYGYNDCGQANIRLTAELTMPDAAQYNMGCYFRYQDDNNTWFVGLRRVSTENGGVPVLRLAKAVTGTWTSYDVSIVHKANQTFQIKVIANGNDINAFWSDSGAAALITKSDAFNNDKTKVGFLGFANGTTYIKADLDYYRVN